MKSSTYYFYMMTKVLANFQICINVRFSKNQGKIMIVTTVNTIGNVVAKNIKVTDNVFSNLLSVSVT